MTVQSTIVFYVSAETLKTPCPHDVLHMEYELDALVGKRDRQCCAEDPQGLSIDRIHYCQTTGARGSKEITED
uniref:Uncharacterized protein n=1 Tax=Ascaris lumbricoides TaxID=6252 RepID=A0A0M3HEZ0_ASCLU